MVRRLLRTAGKVAVISGAATAASGRVARRQRQKLAQEEARRSTAMPSRHEAGADEDLVASLKQLARLRTSGALSEKEFSAAKAKLLAS